MVESGSTTTYLGEGQPFPNWLMYDSSLFEVKLNGKAAQFYAPSPMYDTTASGWLSYEGADGNLPMVVRGLQQGFNLFTNIEADGSVGPYPTLDKSTYLYDDFAEHPPFERGTLELDPEKPLYLHNLDLSTMSGKNKTTVNIEALPYIVCPELNVTLYYNADNRSWQVWEGEVYTEAVLEWRFKQLHTLTAGFPFIEMGSWNYNEYLVDKKAMLNPLVNVIPNEFDTTKVEVHARTYVPGILYNDDNIYPRYQGVSVLAWPNLYKHSHVSQFTACDKAQVMLGITSNVDKTNSVWRINGQPAWLIENTLPEEYDCDIFQSYKDSHRNETSYTKPFIETDGTLAITDGSTIVRYYGNTGLWKIITSPLQKVYVECMLLWANDNESSPEAISNQHYDMTNVILDINNGKPYQFFAFSLINLNAIGLIANAYDIPMNAAAFKNHQMVTTQVDFSNYFTTVPNFERYNYQDFKLYVNDVEVTPTYTFGVNEVLTRVNYPLDSIGAFLDINVANMNAYLDINYDNFQGLASVDSGFSYYMDGDREDFLAMNPETCYFNRCVPIVLQWVYMGEIAKDETIPLFVDMNRNSLKPLENSYTRDDGCYLDYYYTATGKTATLTIGLPINMREKVNYSSLAMKHERDLVRGWVKSKYTGPQISVQDFWVENNKAAWPIVIKPEVPVEEENHVPVLPLTFDVQGFSIQGTFDVNINGQRVAGAVQQEFVETALESTGKLEVTLLDEDAPDYSQYSHQTGDVEIVGEFDVVGNDEELLTNAVVEDMVDTYQDPTSIPFTIYNTLNEAPPHVPPPPVET